MTMTPILTSRGAVHLRPATDEDREFLVGLYGSVRAEELAMVTWEQGQQEAFIRMQFNAQDAEYHRMNPNGTFDVIELQGRPVGRLYVDRRPSEIRIVDISLLPDARGAGIGSGLIAELMDEAAASGRSLTIHVEVGNRAGNLYSRLGFLEAARQGPYRRMEWTPS
jgi:ribosomal protein S18 acetylase RimI-like enzyme